MWQRPPDSASTKLCCEGEAGETLNFRACGVCHRWCGACRGRERSAPLINREEPSGILRDPVEAHFEMQVRAGRANTRNSLPTHNQIAFFDEELRAMRIARDEAVSVVNFDAFSVGGMVICINHFAARGCINSGARFGSEIHAFVEGLVAAKRVNPVSEVRGVINVFNRRQRRQELALCAALNQKRFQHRQLVGLDVDVFIQFAQLFGEIINRERCTDRRCTAASADRKSVV